MIRRANYERELQNIFDNLVLMCRYVESILEKCVQALTNRDPELAREIHEEEKLIDGLERDIENACLKLLVMQQPVASDFREVTAALKMITDLERIGDQAWDIADITTQFKCDGHIKNMEHITQMATIVSQMAKDGVQAYINRDLELARSVDVTDDKVDELFNIVMADLVASVKENPEDAEQAIMLMMITKYLERIGDHAVNISEWVEYAITGDNPKG